MKTKSKLKKTTVTKLTTPEKFLFDFSTWRDMSGSEFHSLKFEAINFYRQHVKAANLFPEAWKWMKKNGYSKNDIETCKNGIGYGGFDSTAAILCKLLNTGCPDFNIKENEYWMSNPVRTKEIYPLSEYVRARVTDGLALAAKRGIADDVSKQKSTQERVLSVQDRMLEQVSPLIADLEGFVDDWRHDKVQLKDLSAYGRFAAFDVKLSPAHAKLIRSHFERMYNEALELIDRNADSDLIEAYGHFSVKQKRDFVKIYSEILSACDLVANEKKQRKPRKKKEVPVDKVVARVKYCAKDVDLGLVSIQPAAVVGKNTVWVYNRKYRVLTKYVAADGEVLTFKGTTIQNFDGSLSDSKKLRKPNEMLKEWSGLNKPKRNKYLATIRTKSMKVTGRVNADCLLLKAE